MVDMKGEEYEKHVPSEYNGIVREPFHGDAVLMKTDDGKFVGIIKFHNDTLYLEHNDRHKNEFSPDDIIGYFGSKTDLKLLFPPSPNEIKVTPRPQNPFEKYRRKKRSISDPTISNVKINRCPLKIVVDHFFVTRTGKNNTGRITKFLANMISRINQIYTNINFDEGRESSIDSRGRFYNMGFSIKEIKLLTEPDSSPIHYNHHIENLTTKVILERFAVAEASNEFCLVHLVTERHFEDKETVGLAYIAADGGYGGICSKRQPPHFNRPAYTNALLTNSVKNILDNEWVPLITKEFDITIAHELGHSWGANHDRELLYRDPDVEDCWGKPEEGRYLMFPRVNSGYDLNNDKFSPCSKKMIRDILNLRYDRCFEAETISFCGNGIIEDGEECDDGNQSDKCCSSSCRLTSFAKCSPSNHICCTKECDFQNSTYICSHGDPMLCVGDSRCSGVSGECPPAPPVENGITCLESGECLDGRCVPFCEKKNIGKKSCSCGQPQYECHRCCRQNNGTCLPETGGGLLNDGTRCTRGYCRKNKCVETSIDTVEHFFINPFKSPSELGKFFRSNIIFIVLVLNVIIFIVIYIIVRKRKEDSAPPSQRSVTSSAKEYKIQDLDRNT